MIRRSEEIPVRDSVNARGGNGTVHFYDFMVANNTDKDVTMIALILNDLTK